MIWAVSGRNIKKIQTPMNLKYNRSICQEGSLLLRTYKNDLGTKQTLYAP